MNSASTTVAAITAWEGFDSRGAPTVGCEVRLEDGATGTAYAPSGASTGTHEVVERRDGDGRYGGRGVLGAVAAVTDELAPALRGMDVADLAALDERIVAIDGTPTLSRLGGNALVALSCAAAEALAASRRRPLFQVLGGDGVSTLPLPMVNVVSGGAHARDGIDIQDVLAIPVGASSFAEAMRWAWDVRAGTAEAMGARGLSSSLVADEGGLAPALATNLAALELVVEGIERAGLAPGEQVGLAIDVAANQLYDGELYWLREHGECGLTSEQLVELLTGWCERLPLLSIEDAVADTDEDGWVIASAQLSPRCQLLGDDLFVTDLERLRDGARRGIANAVLLKPNQTGTLTRTHRVGAEADAAGYATVLSARSGDTEDAWLADVAVAWDTGQIKVGSLTRSERTAKWNRLLQIEAALGERARFAGRDALPASAGGTAVTAGVTGA